MDCVICNVEIGQERLECVPDTLLCIEHAKQIQKFGGEFKLTGTQSNIGKAGSLKKNYGDIDVTRSRNYDAIEKLRKEHFGE